MYIYIIYIYIYIIYILYIYICIKFFQERKTEKASFMLKRRIFLSFSLESILCILLLLSAKLKFKNYIYLYIHISPLYLLLDPTAEKNT